MKYICDSLQTNKLWDALEYLKNNTDKYYDRIKTGMLAAKNDIHADHPDKLYRLLLDLDFQVIYNGKTVNKLVNSAFIRGIEVTIELADGQHRWCYFITPQALSKAGDWLPDSKVRIHYGSPHMIIVSEISKDIIIKTLDYLQATGELETCTRVIDK